MVRRRSATSACRRAPARTNWRTILVAGLNSGGRGYYALDVTNPLAPKALWEFTNSTFCVTTDDPAARPTT
jgi:Tfp pilus tip-associated adhesin PilY1